MRGAKNIIVRLDGRAFIVEVEVSEEELIRTMLSSLDSFINEGFPIRITHTAKQPLSRSQSMTSRILRSIPDLKQWLDEIGKLLRVQGARLFLGD